MEGVEAEEDFEREPFIDSEENIINEEEGINIVKCCFYPPC